MNFSLHDCAMSQAVRTPPLIAEAWVLSQDSPCEISGEQSGTGTGLSPNTSGLPLSSPFHQCSILIFIYALLLEEGQTGKAWLPSKKQCSFGNWEELDRKVLSPVLVFKGLRPILQPLSNPKKGFTKSEFKFGVTKPFYDV
jgi:hypothetical protein